VAVSLPPHRLGQAAADGEAKAGAAEAPRGGRTGPAWVKASNRPGILCWGMPMPVSRTEMRSVSPRGSTCTITAPEFGELDRVVDQVADHLAQGGWDRSRSAPASPDSMWAERSSPLARARSQNSARQSLDQLGRIGGQGFEVELAGLDLGEVEDVVDDRHQALAPDLAITSAKAGAAWAAVSPAASISAITMTPFHRRADFVAHRGQEVALGAAGGLGGVLGHLQVRRWRSATVSSRLAMCAAIASSRLADLGQHVVEAGHQVRPTSSSASTLALSS